MATTAIDYQRLCHVPLRQRLRDLRREAFILLLVGLALAASYVGAYILAVEPRPPWVMTGVPPWPKHATYRCGGRLADRLFQPLVAIDQRLFPRRWKEYGMPDEVIDLYERGVPASVRQDERLKPQYERLRRAISDAADAGAYCQLFDPKLAKGVQARKEVADRVKAAQEAETELRRLMLKYAQEKS
jgi:hypothetical protein